MMKLWSLSAAKQQENSRERDRETVCILTQIYMYTYNIFFNHFDWWLSYANRIRCSIHSGRWWSEHLTEWIINLSLRILAECMHNLSDFQIEKNRFRSVFGLCSMPHHIYTFHWTNNETQRTHGINSSAQHQQNDIKTDAYIYQNQKHNTHMHTTTFPHYTKKKNPNTYITFVSALIISSVIIRYIRALNALSIEYIGNTRQFQTFKTHSGDIYTLF